MNDESQTPDPSPGPELEREERRLERLRLVTQVRPLTDRFGDSDPEPPQEAA
jgi:hypothetical protein